MAAADKPLREDAVSTRRERIATAVMAAMVNRSDASSPNLAEHAFDMAEAAVEMADALIAALKKKSGPEPLAAPAPDDPKARVLPSLTELKNVRSKFRTPELPLGAPGRIRRRGDGGGGGAPAGDAGGTGGA